MLTRTPRTEPRSAVHIDALLRRVTRRASQELQYVDVHTATVCGDVVECRNTLAELVAVMERTFEPGQTHDCVFWLGQTAVMIWLADGTRLDLRKPMAPTVAALLVHTTEAVRPEPAPDHEGAAPAPPAQAD